MSKVTRALRMLALATVLVCLTAIPALAKDYTYTVRVFAGNKGSVNGKNAYVVSRDYAYGDTCTLSRDWVKVKDDKYYVKGFRISGEDATCKETFKVTEDTDVVVAYGVKGNMVDYTISFVEYRTGNALKDDTGKTSLTLKGNVGDKPVVAAAYVPGYRPLYENITGTLKEGENSWTIEYVKIEANETRTSTSTTTYTPGRTTYTVTDEGTTVVNNRTNTTTTTSTTEGADNAGTDTTGNDTTGTDAAGNDTDTAETQAPADTTVNTTTETNDTATEDTEPDVPETQEILDMDNPLAGPGNSTTSETENAHESSVRKASLLASPVGIAGVSALIAAALVGAIIVIRRKRS